MSYARHTRNNAHLAAATVRAGHDLTDQDRQDLRMAKAWCDAILEGKSLDPAEVYYTAFAREVG